MKSTRLPQAFQVGEWRAAPRLGRLMRDGETRAIEPKVMALLVLLAERAGDVVLHEEIMAALWPGVTVGEDSLARCVSKLRRAFDDDPKHARVVETIPKRGYRLVAPVARPIERASLRPARLATSAAALAVVAALAFGAMRGPDAQARAATDLASRGQDYYFNFERADNEAAIALFERALSIDPDNADAEAGLAMALVQQALRWPGPPGAPAYDHTTLGEALADGRTRTPAAQARLARARDLASRAVRTAPHASFPHRALGLTLAASGDLDAAAAAHAEAVARDPDAWGALVNLGDLAEIQGRQGEAVAYFEAAFAAMDRAYAAEPQRVQGWQAELGVLIAQRHEAAGRFADAESWYARTLERAPTHAAAVRGLAARRAAEGDAAEARRLCADLLARVEADAACAGILAGAG